MTLGDVHEYEQYQESQGHVEGDAYDPYAYDAYGNSMDKDGATQYFDDLAGQVSQVFLLILYVSTVMT